MLKMSHACVLLQVMCLFSTWVSASPRGSELDATQLSASGGMSGTSATRPQDLGSMLFGNPATLTQMRASHAFNAGLSYLHPQVETVSDGLNPFVPAQSGRSSVNTIVLPNFSFAHTLSENTTMGVGLANVSGLSSDYRKAFSTSAPVISALEIFGLTLGVGHEINDHVSLGLNVMLTSGLFQFGLVSNTAAVRAYSVTGSAGFTYTLGPIATSGYYRPAYEHSFKGLMETAPGTYSDFTLEQPQELVFGIATTDVFSNDTLLALDLRWKNWGDAQGYESLWQDQTTVSFGLQKTVQTWQYRAGYSHMSQLLKDASSLGNSLGSITSINLPGVATIAVTPPLLQLLQATATNGYWQQNLTVGVSKIFNSTTTLDLFLGYSFDGSQTIAPGFESEGKLVYLGSGLSWVF